MPVELAASLSAALDHEVGRWSSKSREILRRELASPVAYPFELKGHSYQAEVAILEDTSEYLHVVVTVDDTTLLGAIKPLNRSFLLRSDGTVDC